jgi:CRISPR-associated protein Cas1
VRYLNTVYVTDHRARIGRSKGSLIVTTGEAKQRIPLEAVDSVILLGGGHITTDALAACAERQIRVACLRRSGALRFTVAGPRGGNVHLRVAQHRVSGEVGGSLEIAKYIIAAKLQSSRRVLLRWSRDGQDVLERPLRDRADLIGERIGRISTVRDGDHLRGLEGDAARAYFTGVGMVLADSPFPFSDRNRRPPRDPVNALLGFAYGLLVTELIGALEAVGLDHQAGFLHRPRSGRPSLALDLAEEFRPLTDRLVVRILRRRELGPDDFVRTPGGATYLSDPGRERFLRLWESAKNEQVDHVLLRRPVERWALPSVQATLLARHLRGDLNGYPPFVLAG